MLFVWEIPGSNIGREIGYENKFVMVSLCSYTQVLANMVPKSENDCFLSQLHLFIVSGRHNKSVIKETLNKYHVLFST